MVKTDSLVSLGSVLSPFGLQGAVKVFSYCRPKQSIFRYNQWLLVAESGDEKLVTIERHQLSGKYLIVKLKGVDTPERAKEYKNWKIAVAEQQLEKSGEDTFYWYQLEGCRVVLQKTKQVLGVVSHLIETGANDVLVVVPSAESMDAKQRLIPWIIDNTVVDVDVVAKSIVMDWDADY